jgi:hypothetical protein
VHLICIGGVDALPTNVPERAQISLPM